MTTDTQISDRELEILQLVATGATNQQIAQQLNISVNTVKVHLRNIFAKIGVTSRTEATMYAVRAGLVMVAQPPVGAPAEAAPAQPTLAEPAPAVSPPVVPPDASPVAEMVPAVSPASTPIAETAPVVSPALQAESAAAILVSPPVAPSTRRRNVLLIVLAACAAALVLASAVVLLTRQFVAPTVVAAPTSGAVPDKPLRELAALPEGRDGFAVANVAYGGRSYVYAIGGMVGGGASDSVLRYDISANTWVPRRARPTAASDVRAAIIGNKVYVPGGLLASGQPTNACDIYDPARDTWAACAPLPAARSGYALAAVEGKLYLFGGWDGSSYRAEAWQYNPDGNAWSAITAMPTARADADAVTIDRQVYVIGGANQSGALGTNERYTPSEDGSGSPWNTQTALDKPSKQISAVAVGNLVFVLGGDQSGGKLFVYNLDSDSWMPLATPFGSISGARVQSVGTNKFYILGGHDGSALSARAFEYQATYTVFLPGVQQR